MMSWFCTCSATFSSTLVSKTQYRAGRFQACSLTQASSFLTQFQTIQAKPGAPYIQASFLYPPQFQAIQAEPDAQEALAQYRSLATTSACLTILVPPFNIAAANVNDGVRIVSGPKDLCSLSACMRSVLERNRVAFHVLECTSREGRVAEVAKLLAM
jgi:hypothetical protein